MLGAAGTLSLNDVTPSRYTLIHCDEEELTLSSTITSDWIRSFNTLLGVTGTSMFRGLPLGDAQTDLLSFIYKDAAENISRPRYIRNDPQTQNM